MKKNILVVDDSALMRMVISEVIESDERFTLAGTAINGLDALSIMQKSAGEIDAVLLDINMPRMTGLEFLDELKKQNIDATVIIVSSIATEEAEETIFALELGAYDFITKPESYEEIRSDRFRKRLLECLACATGVDRDVKIVPVQPVIPVAAKPKPRTGKKGLKLVAIACSTGGPKALHEILPALPANLNAAITIVQHMPEGFTKSLADRLNRISKIQVKEAQDGEKLKKGTAYIAMGGRQLRINGSKSGGYTLSVTREPPRNGLLPCADIMYESLINTDIEDIICVVLTGMGSDGTKGIMKLYDKKNIYVIAQDEETSVVYGMPRMVRDMGLADEVMALSEIPDAIIKNVGGVINGRKSISGGIY
jgi:two-component system chemotaxis response regulator CheB